MDNYAKYHKGYTGIKESFDNFCLIYMSMGIQWKFYKIAQMSVLYYMKNSVCVPRHEFSLNLYYRSQ